MNNAERFMVTTDFSSMGNDSSTVVSITVPGSIVIPASGTFSYQSTTLVTIGRIGAVTRTQIETSLSPGKWMVGSTMSYYANGSTSSGTVAYQVIVSSTRINPTQVALTVLIPNSAFPATALTTSPSPQTIRFRLSTFVSPFG